MKVFLWDPFIVGGRVALPSDKVLLILPSAKCSLFDDLLNFPFCRDSLLYEQWATTRDLSWMRLMKRRMCVRAMRSRLRRTKATMWEGSRVVGVDKRIV